jgi:hypothetical protein
LVDVPLCHGQLFPILLILISPLFIGITERRAECVDFGQIPRQLVRFAAVGLSLLESTFGQLSLTAVRQGSRQLADQRLGATMLSQAL